jgi:hypothetical protein
MSGIVFKEFTEAGSLEPGVTIDAAGDVAGSFLTSGSASVGFVWSGGTSSTLDLPGGVVRGIASPSTGPGAAWVVGSYPDTAYTAGGLVTASTAGFIDQGGSVTTLLNPDGGPATSGGPSVFTEVQSVNTLGEVAGIYDGSNGEASFFTYAAGSYTDVAVPGATAVVQVFLNGTGDIGGEYSSVDGQGTTHLVPFIDIGGSITTIDMTTIVAGGSAVTVTGFNNSDELVGSYTDGSGVSHGFVYSAGSVTVVDEPLATGGTWINGLNDLGEFVGAYVDSAGTHGFVGAGGHFTTVDDPHATGYSVLYAINDAQTVVGEYGSSGAAIAGVFTAAPGPVSNGLTLLGTIQNQGTIFGDSTGTSAADFTPIELGTAQVTLTGGGQLVFSTIAGSVDPNNEIESGIGGGTATLVNVDNTISGAGSVYPVLVNEARGVVDANGPAGQPLWIAGGGTNDGLLEATAPGILELEGTIDQRAGGTILAVGAGSTAELYQADVVGGTIETSGGGVVFSLYGTIDGSAGAVTIAPASTLTTTGFALSTQGAIVNLGTLLFSHADMIALAGTTTLSGGGVVDFNSVSVLTPGALVNVDNTIVATAPVTIGNGPTLAELTNMAAGTIDVAGVMGMYTTAVVANAGLIEVTGTGNLLTFENTTIEQAGGGTLLANGSGDEIAGTNVSIPDGVLANENGGAILLYGSVDTLGNGVTGPTIEAGGLLDVPSTTTLVLASATVFNPGEIGIGSAAPLSVTTSELGLELPVTTFTGGGTIGLLFDPYAPSYNDIANVSGGAVSMVNVNNLIEGLGTIGLGGSFSLTNEAAGVIDASGSRSLEIDATGGIVNAGLMESTYASLTFGGATIDNTGGTIATFSNAYLAGTGLVTFTGDVIEGGALVAGVIGNNPYNSERGGFAFNGAGNTIDGSASAVAFIGSGSFSVAAGATLDLVGTLSLSGIGFAVSGLLRNDGTLDGAGSVAGTITNNGVLRADGGTLSVSGDVLGGGTMVVGSGAGLSLGGASGEVVDFGGLGGGVLDLGAPAAFTGTLAGLQSGDMIVLAGADVVATPVVAGSMLTLELSGGATLDYALSGFSVGETVQLVSASSGQSVVEVACFASGTGIATARGRVPVEALREGMLVLTASGRLAPVRWIGQRRTDLRRHPRPHDVMPVRVMAGAFGPPLPSRDLCLSPDHAVFVDGVLVPVRHLINGVSIVQETRATVTYWHVELDRHDVILAEDLPCESFLDTGNRCAFENAPGAVAMTPDFARAVWAAEGCAPILTDPRDPTLRALHLRLLARAGQAGQLRNRNNLAMSHSRPGEG